MSHDIDYASVPAGEAAPFAADRRSVLRSVAAMSLVGVGATLLSACSSSTAAGAVASSSPATTTSGGVTPSSPAATAAGTSAGGAMTIVAAVEVPVGGGKIVDFAGAPVVVVQPKVGTFVAYSAVCPHAGCTVSSVDAHVIICGCHNSQFSVTDGSVTAGPSPSGLQKIAVSSKNGNIIVNA